MSTHFTNGNIYGPTVDSSPATIIVDPLATIQASGNLQTALTLNNAPWFVTINGKIFSDDLALVLAGGGNFTSDVRVGSTGSIISQTESAILSGHPTNVTNAGTIAGGAFAIQEAINGDFTISNSGSMFAGLYAISLTGSGTHTIGNSGLITGTNHGIRAEEGIEKITNSGTIGGKVSLGDGGDTFTNFATVGSTTKSGSVSGNIDLGAGNDIFNGGGLREFVLDGPGGDTIKFGAGPDHWVGFLSGNNDGVDRIDGGAGIDAYDASKSGVTGANGAVINLDTKTRSGVAGLTVDDFKPTTLPDKIVSIENAFGTGARDFIYGTQGANTIVGGGGGDFLYGLGGKDLLQGDQGADRFNFLALSDSRASTSTRDTITDFQHGTDKIDLTSIDAALGNKIHFLGAAKFDGKKGALHVVQSGNRKIVELDSNGDKKADFSIALEGNPTIAAGDFLF